MLKLPKSQILKFSHLYTSILVTKCSQQLGNIISHQMCRVGNTEFYTNDHFGCESSSQISLVACTLCIYLEICMYFLGQIHHMTIESFGKSIFVAKHWLVTLNLNQSGVHRKVEVPLNTLFLQQPQSLFFYTMASRGCQWRMAFALVLLATAVGYCPEPL